MTEFTVKPRRGRKMEVIVTVAGETKIGLIPAEFSLLKRAGVPHCLMQPEKDFAPLVRQKLLKVSFDYEKGWPRPVVSLTEAGREALRQEFQA